MKVVTILGARPQFVKAAAVSRAFNEYPNIKEVIVHTGQHFDANMSEVFFTEMGIPKPDYNLQINSLGHGAMTGRMLEEIEKILIDEKPKYVVVYGDTNSTIAGALAAKKLHISLVHIEAGLRSFNMEMPEEINRILTDRISDILFCPTETAINNLEAEGYANIDTEIVQCGDVMEDVALHYNKLVGNDDVLLNALKIESGKFVLCTMHRQENTDDPATLKRILTSLHAINEIYPVVMPIHPRTAKKIADLGLEIHFKTVEPLGYFDMIRLIRNSKIVLTDSGGLQKEAYFFEKFCITLREQTEWVELVNNGFNKIVGSNQDALMEAFDHFKNKSFEKGTSLYGDGKASSVIAKRISQE